MVVVSMLPHAEIGGNDHREEAPYFIFYKNTHPNKYLQMNQIQSFERVYIYLPQ